MMGARSLVLAIRLLMLIPFLGIMGYGLLMTKFGNEMTSGEGGFATNILTKVSAAYLDYSANRQKDAVFSTAELNDERVVYLSRDYVVVQTKADVSGTINESRVQIAALAQGKMEADRECAAMIASFATSCVLSGARAALGDDGMMRLDLTLSFTTDAPVGDLEGKDTEGLIPHTVSLTGDEGFDVAPQDVAAERARLYPLAQAACDALLASDGTCAIKSVSFEEEPAEGGKVRLRANATLTSLGERATVSSMLKQLNATPAADATDPLAAASGFAKAMVEANDALKAAEVQEAPSADSLFDRADKPRFQNAQGGAKFVTPP